MANIYHKGNVFLSLLVTLALLVSLVPLGGPAAAQGETITNITVQSNTVSLGGTTTTTIMMNGISGPNGPAAFDTMLISYDRLKVNVDYVSAANSGITAGDAPFGTPSHNASLANNTGALNLGWFDMAGVGTGGPIASLRVATVRWKALQAGVHNLTLTLGSINDMTGTPITVSALVSGTLTVWAYPVASFTEDKSSGNTPLTVQFTDTSAGPAQSWNWNFGDGTGSSSQNPSKTYNNAGDYTVSLVVTNPVGTSTNNATAVKRAWGIPDAIFTESASSGLPPLTIQFTDQSTGNITTWNWIFGDGTANSNTKNPSHTYSTPGIYTVVLSAGNPRGTDTATATKTVWAYPVASFSEDKSSGNAPMTVQFTDTSSGPATGWDWDFGDGTAHGNTKNPVHVYSTPGNYTVRLVVSNPAGQSTNNATALKQVWGQPVAVFTEDKSSGNTPLTVQFTDGSTGNITSWSWTFGDGVGTSNTKNPTYTYSTPGNYTVTLTVNNPGGFQPGTATAVKSAYGVPAASFNESESQGNIPWTVFFFDTSTGNITTWDWNWGDGTTRGTTLHGQHTYNTPGNYTVTLTVNNPRGPASTATAVKRAYGIPSASFTALPTSTNPGTPIQFTDTSYGNITTWSWSFGDLTGSSSQNPSKSYAADGTYRATLTVNNPRGPASSSFFDITIVSYKAETALVQGATALPEAQVYLAGKINRFFNPVPPNDTVVLPDGLGAFEAVVSYLDTKVTMKGGAAMAPFSGAPGYAANQATITGFQASYPGPQPGSELFRLYPWLTSSVLEDVTFTLRFNTITLANPGGTSIPQNADVTKTFRRGNADNSTQVPDPVTMSDALWIAQFRVGTRGLGETTALVNAINAATPQNDSPYAKITINDALFIAQYRVQLRDGSFNWLA
ncbi:MAG: PKD domain-containing protein [Chloroflexi bacterium]|nr:PKD domain-containing protein [Chloroflexota bacterium]